MTVEALSVTRSALSELNSLELPCSLFLSLSVLVAQCSVAELLQLRGPQNGDGWACARSLQCVSRQTHSDDVIARIAMCLTKRVRLPVVCSVNSTTWLVASLCAMRDCICVETSTRWT